MKVAHLEVGCRGCVGCKLSEILPIGGGAELLNVILVDSERSKDHDSRQHGLSIAHDMDSGGPPIMIRLALLSRLGAERAADLATSLVALKIFYGVTRVSSFPSLSVFVL